MIKNNKYKELKFDNKVYNIKKIPGKQVMRLLGLVGVITAKPIGALICVLFTGSREEKISALSIIEACLQSPELIKENVIDILTTVNDNFETIEDVINTILSNTSLTVEEDGTKEEFELNYDNFCFDDLDEWVELLITAFKFNLETGLKKTIKKYPLLGLELK